MPTRQRTFLRSLAPPASVNIQIPKSKSPREARALWIDRSHLRHRATDNTINYLVAASLAAVAAFEAASAAALAASAAAAPASLAASLAASAALPAAAAASLAASLVASAAAAPASLAASTAFEAAVPAAAAASLAASAAALAASLAASTAGAGASTGAGAGAAASSFLPQAASATAAINEARTTDFFIWIFLTTVDSCDSNQRQTIYPRQSVHSTRLLTHQTRRGIIGITPEHRLCLCCRYCCCLATIYRT